MQLGLWETDTLFINCQEAIPARQLSEFLGHPQPPTPMQTNNTMAFGVVNQNVMKKIKSMDMKYHWLWCRISQEQCRYYWKDGKSNWGDYVTKHHPAIHHQVTRPSPLAIISVLVNEQNRLRYKAMTTLTKPPGSKGVLDISGWPNTASDYQRALAASRKLITESVTRGPVGRSLPCVVQVTGP